MHSGRVRARSKNQPTGPGKYSTDACTGREDRPADPYSHSHALGPHPAAWEGICEHHGGQAMDQGLTNEHAAVVDKGAVAD